MPDGLSWVFLCACSEVFKAKHRQTGQKVALKKVLMENEKEGVSGPVGTPSRLGRVCLDCCSKGFCADAMFMPSIF